MHFFVLFFQLRHRPGKHDRLNEERRVARGRHGRVRRPAEPGPRPGRLPRLRAPSVDRQQEGRPADDGPDAAQEPHPRSASAAQSNFYYNVEVEVVAKGLELERWSRNLEVPSSNPHDVRAFFSTSFNGRVSLIRSLKRVASLLFFPK